MDWEIRKIEKYYLTQKDPKLLYKNVESMTPQELREIVMKIFILQYNSSEQISFLNKKQKSNY